MMATTVDHWPVSATKSEPQALGRIEAPLSSANGGGKVPKLVDPQGRAVALTASVVALVRQIVAQRAAGGLSRLWPAIAN